MESCSSKELRVPEYLKAPWLTEEYVAKNGWIPVPDDWLEGDSLLENTPFGRIPWKSRSEYLPGDIIIFNEYQEISNEKGTYTDRFIVIEKEDIEGYKRGERELLPKGIVVHDPSNLEFIIQKVDKILKNPKNIRDAEEFNKKLQKWPPADQSRLICSQNN